VHDRDDVQEASAHRDVDHVCAPDLVRPVDGQMAKQIGPPMRFAGLRALVDRRQTRLEQSADGPDGAQRTSHCGANAAPSAESPVPRRLEELFVDETHQPPRLFILRCRLTVE
jgi:hypothetical protein